MASLIFYTTHIIGGGCGAGRGGAAQDSLDNPAWVFVPVFCCITEGQLQNCPPSCLCLGKTACHCQAAESSTVLSLSRPPYGTRQGAENLFVCNSSPLLYTFVINMVVVTVRTLSH